MFSKTRKRSAGLKRGAFGPHRCENVCGRMWPAEKQHDTHHGLLGGSSISCLVHSCMDRYDVAIEFEDGGQAEREEHVHHGAARAQHLCSGVFKCVSNVRVGAIFTIGDLLACLPPDTVS